MVEMWCKRCKAVVTNTTIICGGVTRTESSCPHPVFMKSKDIPPEAGLTPSADLQQDVGVDEADDTSEADTATTIASTVESVRLHCSTLCCCALGMHQKVLGAKWTLCTNMVARGGCSVSRGVLEPP